MAQHAETGYPWNGPEYDVIAEDEADLSPGPTATMKSSNTRTNYIRVGKHGFHIDEPEEMNHSFKKGRGGKNEAPSAFAYLMAAAMGCQVGSLELLFHKSRIEEYKIDAECTGYTHVEDDIKRVQKLGIDLTITVPEGVESRVERCLDLYEKGCMVGESIKRGMGVEVSHSVVTVETVGD